MSWWNGSRWVSEREASAPTPTPAPRRRLGNWAATGIVAAALVGLAIPMATIFASTPRAASSLIDEWSAAGAVRAYTEASTRIHYKGSWLRADQATHLGGHVMATNQAHAKASLWFNASGFSWVGPMGPTRGKANVFVDGKFVKTVNTYASSFTPQRVLFTATWATVGTHKVTIDALGTAGHPTVAVDALLLRLSSGTNARKNPKPTPKPTAAPSAAPSGAPSSGPALNPVVLLSEDIGPGGTQTVLSMSGFAPNSSGAIDFDGSTAGMPTYSTNGSGLATATVTIPVNASIGQHQLRALAASGESMMMRIFEVTPGNVGAPAPTATPQPTSAPTTAPTATPAPTTAPAPTPAPTTPPAGSYAAVFSGDASGATDVTSSLRSFLQSHNGQHVALATNGVYKVTQLTFTASNLTVDFRGARLQGAQIGAFGILKIRNATNLVLNDPKVYGTGYIWADNTQWEHGFDISGGSNIVLNNPYTRNVRGDGIFTGYEPGVTSPPTGVVINNPNIERSARNGIAPVGGQVTIRGGHIAYSGLHGIDLEPNDSTEAGSLRVVIDGIDIRSSSNLPVVGYGYAISAGWGHLGTMKPSLLIQNVTGDRLSIVVMNTSSLRVLNNISDGSAVAEIIASPSVSFTGNIRISRI